MSCGRSGVKLKIYSKFQDYYDSAQGSFTESETVYDRKQEISELSLQDVPSLGEEFFPSYMETVKGPDGKETKEDCYVIMLGFCGNYYYGLSYDYMPGNPGDEYTKYMVRHMEHIHRYITFEDFRNYRVHPWLSSLTGKWLTKYERKIEMKDPSKTEWWKDDIFEKYGPVFCVGYPKAHKYSKEQRNIVILKNPCLKNMAFLSVLDPFSCLYHIDNWLDSHARPDDAVVPVGDDITRLQAYGFDKKTSFRKPKEENRK